MAKDSATACRHGFDFLKGWPPLLYLEGWIPPFRMGVRMEILRLTAMVGGQAKGRVLGPATEEERLLEIHCTP